MRYLIRYLIFVIFIGLISLGWIDSVNGIDLIYEDYDNIFSVETREKDIIANISVTYDFEMVSPVYSIDVIGNISEFDIPLRIEILKNVSNWTSPAPDIVYKYFNLVTSSKRIKEFKIKYALDNIWIEQYNIENVKLYQWNDSNKSWNVLYTNISDQNDETTYFESITDNSSYFAIVGKNKLEQEIENEKKEEQIVEEIKEDNKIKETENIEEKLTQEPGTGELSTIILTFILLILISILIVLILIFLNLKKDN